MDVELMCLMRHLRRSGRSAWGRGHPREKPGVDGGLGVSAGKLERPGRCVNTICPDLTTGKGWLMTDHSASTDNPCHTSPLPPEFYCPTCGAYNPDEGDARG